MSSLNYHFIKLGRARRLVLALLGHPPDDRLPPGGRIEPLVSRDLIDSIGFLDRDGAVFSRIRELGLLGRPAEGVGRSAGKGRGGRGGGERGGGERAGGERGGGAGSTATAGDEVEMGDLEPLVAELEAAFWAVLGPILIREGFAADPLVRRCIDAELPGGAEKAAVGAPREGIIRRGFDNIVDIRVFRSAAMALNRVVLSHVERTLPQAPRLTGITGNGVSWRAGKIAGDLAAEAERLAARARGEIGTRSGASGENAS